MTNLPQIILGCFLTDNACVDKAIEMGCRAEMFGAYNSLFDLCVKARISGTQFDLGSIAIMGADWKMANECSDWAPTTSGFKDAVERLIWDHKRTKLIQEGKFLLEELKKSSLEDSDAVSRRLSEMQQVAQKSEENDDKMEDIVNEIIADLDADLAGTQRNSIELSWGMLEADRFMTPIRKHELVVCAARPSCGKSSLAIHLARTWLKTKHNVAFFSLETSKKAVLMQIAGQEAGVDIQQMKLQPKDRVDYYRKCLAVLAASPHLQIFDRVLTLDGIEAKCRLLASSFKPHAVVIDYLNIINHHAGGKGGLYEKTTEISQRMIGLRKYMDCPIILLAQLNRANVNDNNRAPEPHDLRDSGCLSVNSTWLLTPQGVQRNSNSRMNLTSLNSTSESLSTVERESKNIPKGNANIIRLNLRSGRFIECTKDHPILTDVGFVAADKITREHSIAAVRSIPEPKGTIKIPESKFIGWMIGNGSMVGYSSPSFICSCEKVSDDFCAFVADRWELTPHIHKHKCEKVFQYDLTAGPVRTSKGNPIKDWLKQNDMWDRRSHEKRIPSWFCEQADNASIAELVAGLWETDGTVTGKCLKYSTTSEELSWQVIWALSRLGIFAYRSEEKQRTGCHKLYVISIHSSRDVNLFRSIIPMVGRKMDKLRAVKTTGVDGNNGDRLGKWVGYELMNLFKIHGYSYKLMGYRPQGKRISHQDLKRLCDSSIKVNEELGHLVSKDVYWDRLDGVEVVERGPVFDREVIDGPHNFAANGIIVHNSVEQDAHRLVFIHRPNDLFDTEQPQIGKDGMEPSQWHCLLMQKKLRDGPRASIRCVFNAPHTTFNSYVSKGKF